MRKITKFIIGALAFIGIVIIAFSFYRWQSIKNLRKCQMDDILPILQPVYAAITWEKLCDDNGIDYSEQYLNEIIKKYQLVINNTELTGCSNFYGYLYAACNEKLINPQNDTFDNFTNQYYEQSTGLYSRFFGNENTSEKVYADVQTSITVALKKERYGLNKLNSVDEGLIAYYNNCIDTGDYTDSKTEIINIIYYFWTKDKCANININCEEIQSIFGEIYENNSTLFNDSENWNTSMFGTRKYVEICDAIGVETGTLKERLGAWNVLDTDVENWMLWRDMTLLDGVFVSGIYYDELIGGNEKYSDDIRFTESFGQGLDAYCKDVVIPELNSLIKKYNMK